MRGSNMFLKGCLLGVFVVALTAGAHAELILYYSFDQNVGPGGTVVNQANPGTYNGTLQHDAYTNGFLNLDGTDDFLQTTLPTGNLTTPVTFSFWMNASQVRKSPILSGYLSGNSNRWDIQLSRSDDQKIRFIAHEDKSGGPRSTTSIAANTWYHVAVVHRGAGSTVSLYVNGALESTTSMAYGLNTGIDMMIGKGDGFNFAGQLDEVAIWTNEALSSGQIRGIAQRAAVAIRDGDWNTAANWFSQPPDATQDAVIAGSRTLTISSGTAQANNLVIGAAGETATLNLAGGTLTVAGNITRGATGTAAFHWTGGTLHVDTFGTATVPFDLNQLGGVLAPGRSIGSTTIYGNYLQEEAGMLEIEIASPTNFDTVSVFGNAELHGDIVVKLLDGYIPAVGQTFPILSTTGSLDITNLGVIQSQAMAGGWILLTAPRQGGGELLILQAVPEPSSGSLALLGLAGLGLAAGYRLRRRPQGS